MKKTFYLVALFAFLLIGCKDDPGLNKPAGPYLPKITIATENNAPVVSKDDYLNATFTFYDSLGKHTSIDATPTTIKGRGNATWDMPKKPYRLKFPSKMSLFGLAAAKDWILLANYMDPSFLCNPIAFEAARRLGVKCANSSFFAELYLNGEYQGVYLVTEQVEINEGRVDIEEDDNSMLLEFDSYYDEAYKFRTDIVNMPVMLKHPETDQGVENASTLMNKIESLLFADNYLDNWDELNELIDMNSLVSYLQVFELTLNAEISTTNNNYAYKNSTPGSKLTFGPVWDFDLGYGLIWGTFIYFENYSHIMLSKHTADLGSENNGFVFFCRFLHYPEFVKLYKDNWNNNLSKLDFNDFIDSYVFNLKNYFAKEYEKWPRDNWVGNHDNYEETVLKLKNWMSKRIEYMTTEINKMESISN